MQDIETTEGIVVPGEEHAEGGLPQMNAETYASQLFWLVLTFGFLLVVLSKVALPKIGSVIAARKDRITGDLETAERLRKEASDALAAYESALASARGRATTLADEKRKTVNAEMDRLKAAADAQTQTALTEAEARIEETRKRAAGHVQQVASEAAADIVERLIGEKVSSADALQAVQSIRG